MAPAQDYEELFKDETYVSNYQIGEKVTGEFAKALIEQSNIASFGHKPLVVLDCACGTGIISSTLNSILHENTKKHLTLTCGDISEGMLEYTKQRSKNEDWNNVDVREVDAQNTGLPAAHYTHIFAAFESLRILQPGGTIAISTWQSPGWIPIVKSAIKAMSGNLPFPTTEEFLKMNDGQWDNASWVESQLRTQELDEIQVTVAPRSISLGVDEFINITMSTLPFILAKFWTQEQRDQSESQVRPTLCKYMEESYGTDGVVSMDYVAVIATGRKSL